MQTIEELQDIWMAPSGTELPFPGKDSKPREKSSYHTLERGYVGNQRPGNEGESSMNVYLVLSMESEAAQVIVLSLRGLTSHPLTSTCFC